MHRRFATIVLLGSVLAARGGSAQQLAPVSLPAPQTEGGKPLMQALKLRATARATQALAHADAAFISQNVYLFCASEGLATGVRASVDRPALAKALKLRDKQLIVFAQSVGLPKKP